MHLVHRDVSPQNILVGVDGRARMTDFGIAHALYLRNTHTRVGEKKGKFSYFSPEQAKDEAIDRRSDVFALGVVGWEMMTGRRLFRGQPMEALELVQSKEIPPPVRLRPDLSQEASDVVMLALERDRDRRYATAGQFASALRRAALAFGELPSPRVIGRFVEEAGGDHLARIRDTMARADMGEVPVTVPAAGTQILPEGTPTPSNPESTWVPGKGATSLITGERTFTGGLVVPPDDPASTRLLKAPDATSATLPSDQLDTILQEEGLHAAATVIVDEAIRGSDAGLEPLENAPTSAWNGQITTTPGLRRAQSRSWTLALSVGGILLLGGVGFAVALAATFDGESAETVDGPPPPRVLDVRTRPAGHQEPVRAEQAPPETAREVGVEVSAEPEGPAEETAEDGLSEGEPPDEIDEEARRRALLRRERLRREREQRTTRAERAEMRASMPTEMAASMTKTTSSGLPTGLDW
jgi:serine/threonine-protein kinase